VHRALLVSSFVGVSMTVAADDGNPPRVQTLVLARAGWDRGVTYRFFEAIHSTGRWIAPDVGYIDFGDARRYREFWLGGGYVLHGSPRTTVIGEGYLAQATGPLAGGARYFQPWMLVAHQFAPRVGGEAVYFLYLPLNAPGAFQQVLERAKLELTLGKVKLGAGYGAYKAEGQRWQHKPFLTFTYGTSRLGSLELWLQRNPGPGDDIQAQVRYMLRVAR
jgi:hypothetical protein